MYFSTKNYLKSNRYHTANQSLEEPGSQPRKEVRDFKYNR